MPTTRCKGEGLVKAFPKTTKARFTTMFKGAGGDQETGVSTQFSDFAEALSQSKGLDALSLLDSSNGLATLFADICAQRGNAAQNEAGSGGISSLLRSSGNAGIPLSGFLELYEDDDGDDAIAWRLEEQTWRLIQQLHAERLQRSLEERQGQNDAALNSASSSSSSKGNPYRTPLIVVQDIIDADAALAELNIVREWLSNNLSNIHAVEVRKGYWPFTKNKLRNERRTSIGSGTNASSSSASIRTRTSVYGTNRSTGTSSTSKGVKYLDPDATTRESSTLELEDAAYEKALNKTLFEYARSGQLNNAIDLARQTDRSWRAASMRGANLYWRPDLGDEMTTNDELSNPIGNRNRTLWKAVCRSMCARPSLDEFERALYGALSGDLKSVLQVSTTWDAQLWAYANARLEGAIDANLNKLGSWWGQDAGESFGLPRNTKEMGAVRLAELTVPSISGNVGANAASGQSVTHRTLSSSDPVMHVAEDQEAPLAVELRDVFARLTQTEQHGIHVQANHPFRIVQRAVILSELPALLTHVESLLPSMRVSVSVHQYARLVRFFAHLILFLRLIKWDKMPNDVVCNSILKAYVDVLESVGGGGGQGNDDLIALYASSLEPESATESYAHYLKTIDAQERPDFKQAALLRAETHDLDVAAVAVTTVTMIFDELCPALMQMFDTPANGPLDQLSTTITPSEERLIRAIDWLCIHESTHAAAIVHVNALMRLFLIKGRLNAARKLLFELPSAVLEKAGQLEEQGDPECQAIEFVHLRSLFDAIDCHLRYVEVWSRRPSEKSSRMDHLGWAKGLDGVVEEARKTIMQVLQMDWLKFASAQPTYDDQRRIELARIRQMYIPELVGRLHTMLYDARDILPNALATAVQLPNLVADERHKLYLDFITDEQNRLSTFMQRVRLVELASLARHHDPFHLSSVVIT